LPFNSFQAVDITLKWSAIDFKSKTITIRHIVTEATVEGKVVVIEKDRTKTKSSHRTLPLVPQFESLHLRLKEQQEENKAACKKSYQAQLHHPALSNRTCQQ